MRLRAEYKVGSELRFLGNLDMINLMKRALRRANIPYALSEGYNPHVKLSMGTVLPVGLWSEREYFDLDLKDNVEPQDFVNRMNAVLPISLRINTCIQIPIGTPALMKVINTAGYSILVERNISNLQDIYKTINSADILEVQSKGKKKDIIKDIKPGILTIDIQEKQDSNIINVHVSTGDPVNVRYDELLEVFIKYGLSENGIKDLFRFGNFIKQGNNFYTPLEKVK